MIEELIQKEKEGKEYTLDVLRKSGYWCRDCRGNFIFVEPNQNARALAQRLKEEKRILVHAYGNELLKDLLRVSIGSKEAMQIFLDGFLDLDKA